ncbi:hypothetical protein Tco_1098927 [Tanacetum coccineum]
MLVMLPSQRSRRFDVLLDKGSIRTSGPTDGANVEAYLRGPLGHGKRASNVRIAWFSFGSFGSVSFGSSAESKNVVQLRLLWRLLQLLRPLAESLLRRSAPEVCSRVLLRRSAPTWRDLLGLSLGLRVVDCHYLLLINWRRYTSSAPLAKALSNRLVTMGRSTCKSTLNLCRSPHCGDVGL